MISQFVRDLLEEKYLKFNNPDFIALDPICIPHAFKTKQDIEISGFFAATLAWGQRKTIINNCRLLMSQMDNAPFEFIKKSESSDLKKLEKFVHRTFNSTDLLYFVDFLKSHYSNFVSLEDAFFQGSNTSIQKERLIEFQKYFFSLEHFPKRTKKHISSPIKNSACKRINMFLRWMVRKDNKGVDFGIWSRMQAVDLICPCDVHVQKTAKILQLTTRTKADWAMAEEITSALSEIDKKDPVKYDFALFGLGIENYFSGITAPSL
jgi:uncharacterized protein (TIGR02757 family)